MELTSQLELLDAWIGQADRHPGNVFIQAEAGKAIALHGIDNDLSFPINAEFPVENAVTNDLRSYQYRFPGVPPVVDRYAGQGIIALTPAIVGSVFKDLLGDRELEALNLRLIRMQGVLKTRLQIEPSEWHKEEVLAALARSENGYLTRWPAQVKYRKEQRAARIGALIPDAIPPRAVGGEVNHD